MKKINLQPKYITVTFNRDWLYMIPILLAFLTFLIFLNALKNPKFETYNGYMMNFAGELIQIEKLEVKAEEPPKEPTLDEYIIEKFGHDAWKAFAILHGTKWCGGENGKHNPDAYNVNSDAIQSTDWGYWQFNDKWHPEVTRECAKDVKCSTDRAYEMFVHDGGFKQWTAGDCIGV